MAPSSPLHIAPAALPWTALALLLTGCSGQGEPAGDAPDPDSPSVPTAGDGPGPADVDGTAGDGDRDAPARDDGDDAEDPAAEEAASETSDAVQQEKLSIRDTDFAVLEWTEWVNEVVLIPSEGLEGFQFEVADEVHYADVTGDGHEDALVSLGWTDERGFEEIWYIWAWDPDTESAYQAGGPVARAANCGDHVESVAAGDGYFVVEEYLWPQNSDHDCASTPSIHVTRHLVLEDDWPVMISPVRAHGGMCPQILGTDDLWPVEDFEFRTSPEASAGLVGDPAPVSFAEADVWSRLWLYYPNWMLAHLAYMNPADGPPVVEGGYTPCGWVYLEEDNRPVPHDPYLDEGGLSGTQSSRYPSM